MRNKYSDGTFEEAQFHGLDTIQLKYDGHWCKCVSSDGRQTYFSDTDRVFLQTAHPLPDCILIGEFMRGTQWAQHPNRKGNYYVFDMWDLHNEPLLVPYRNRMRLLRTIKMPFVVVQSFPINARDILWNTYIETQDFEGIIYRDSQSTLRECSIMREKRTVTLDGLVTRFLPGTGKHEGRLGALEILINSTNTKTTLGNGFSDSEREYIWSHQAEFLGRTCEFVASAVFESGSVRHSRFIRWRDDRPTSSSTPPSEQLQPASAPDSEPTRQ